MNKRSLFLSALGGIACLLGAGPHSAPPHQPLSITVRADTPGAVINPAIYGQFAEHLGGLIYDGIWVGEKSAIPNTRGYRNDVLAALKELGVPVLRWPGGCFADEYHWRDGIGPREQRPRKVNTHWGGVVEDNSFGTHEFMDFAELIGADAYVTGNVGTGTPQEMADWIEYMTSDTDSTLAQLRRKNGRDKPWKVNYFGDRQRDLGLRRQHAPRVLRRPLSPLRHVHQSSRGREAPAHRQRREWQRPAVDRGADARSHEAHGRDQRALLHAAHRQVGQERRGHEVHGG